VDARFWSPRSTTPLAPSWEQRQDADKSGENTALQPSLSSQDAAGMVITLDALHVGRRRAA
jgi:hypothetical protein